MIPTRIFIQLSLSGTDSTPIRIPDSTTDSLNIVESVNSSHADIPLNDKVASLLGITRPPVKMDSQGKYASLARGDARIYLRIPKKLGYQEKIWVMQQHHSFF